MVGKVTHIIPKSKSSPLILTFQNGTIAGKTNGEKRKVSLEMNEKTGLRGVKVKIGDHEYEGDEEQSLTGRRTFLIVRKAETGDMKFVEVSRSTPLLNTLHKVREEKEAIGGDYKSRNSALQKLFGGKKSKRMIEKSEKFQMNASTNESSLLTTVNEMTVKKEEASVEKQIAESMADFLPPCHRDAVNVNDVYQLPEILGQEVIDALSDFSLANLPPKNELLDFTQKVIEELPAKQSPEVAVAVCMIESILRFVKLAAPAIRKYGAKFSEHEAIHNKIIELFCHKSGNHLMRSLLHKDKAIGYCIVLAAATTKSVHVDILARDSGFGKAKLLQFCRTIGCVKEGKASMTCVLKLPLPPIALKTKFR